jgi:hypothetical protein
MKKRIISIFLLGTTIFHLNSINNFYQYQTDILPMVSTRTLYNRFIFPSIPPLKYNGMTRVSYEKLPNGVGYFGIYR